MSALPHLALFLADAALTAAAGWLLVRLLEPGATGILERGLGWLLAVLLLVSGSAVMLGALGGLGSVGFFAAHLVVLVVLRLLRGGRAAEDWRELARWMRESRDALNQPGAERWAATALALVLVALGVLAALGEPLVYDALTYRLPRIGQWLQDGRIGSLVTDDARLNYLSEGQDLVVAWLVGAWQSGFRYAQLAQALGAVLLVGATAGLARQTGLSRVAALGAGALVLGLGNVAPQATSAHNDLYAAGLFSASFYLWLAATRRGGGGLAGAGLAAALAAKGTVFYVLPSALGWVAWFAWRRRLRARPFVAAGLGLVVGAALLLAPGFWRNHRTYGRWAAPDDAMVQHYGPALGAAQRMEKLELNLRSALAQLFEPSSQPWGWRAPSLAVARRLAATLPSRDPYAFEELDRRGTVLLYLGEGRPDADFAGPGVPMLLLFGAGALLALIRFRQGEEPPTVLAWAAGVAGYVLVQYGLLQWHPWTFRYAVLVAPWLVIVAAWLIERLPGRARAVLWVVTLALAAGILVESTFLDDQVGWHAWLANGRPALKAGGWRTWSATLGAEAQPLRVALPVNRPLALLHRQEPTVDIRLLSLSALPAGTAEMAVGKEDGWLIVPAARFAGREGRVVARTWLWQGDENDQLSLAAYRALRPGESPAPVVYRNFVSDAGPEVRHDIRLRSWTPAVSFQLANASAVAWSYRFTAPRGEASGSIPAHGETWVRVPASADGLTECVLHLQPPSPATPRQPAPAIVAVQPAE